MENNQVKIVAKSLSKSFQLEKETYHALQDINFEIKHGERVGIIGENGAGKTTLLNIICGFLKEDSGSKEVCGNINALMSLGTGLKEELSGRENIYIDAELHNISKSSADDYIDEIIDFADIGEYIDKPVKVYSSGMKARLMFSIMTRIKPEILIIDEVLGVGDAEFSKKATKRVEELCSSGQILIAVSHSMSTIRNMTNRTIWLENGKIKKDGRSEDIVSLYQKQVHEKEEKNLLEQFKLRQESYLYHSKLVIANTSIVSQGENKTLLYTDDSYGLTFTIKASECVEAWDLRISILKMDGTLLIENCFSKDMDVELMAINKDERREFEIDLGILKFSEGTFEILCEAIDGTGTRLAQSFVVLQVLNFKYEYASKPESFCEYSIISEE